jgi:hypothetical protein
VTSGKLLHSFSSAHPHEEQSEWMDEAATFFLTAQQRHTRSICQYQALQHSGDEPCDCKNTALITDGSEQDDEDAQDAGGEASA